MLAVGFTLWRSQGGSCNNEEDKVNGEIFKTAGRDKWLPKGDGSFQMEQKDTCCGSMQTEGEGGGT